jgi:hypothetical protein
MGVPFCVWAPCTPSLLASVPRQYASFHMRPSGRTTVLLFLFFQALYALTSSGNAFRVPDEFEVYFQVEHLVDAGDISVPQTLAIRTPVTREGEPAGSEPIFFGEFGRGGRPYAPYGPLAAVLALPHHLLARAIARLAGVDRSPLPGGLAWVFLVGGLTMTATATAAALAVAGFHRSVVALGTPERSAVFLSLLLGVATVLWPYGTSFYSEAWQAAAFSWAAALLLAARRTSRLEDGPSGLHHARLRVVGAALLLTIAGLTKVTSLIFASGFVVAALLDRSLSPRTRLEAAVALALGMALAAAIHVAWNTYRFGRPFDFGYGWGDMIPQLPPRQFLAADVPRGLAVLLFSPGKSIVLWAPILLLAGTRAKPFWRREPGAAIGLAISAVAGLIFFAAYLFPEGGYAHGPRNLVPLVPLLLLPAGGPDSGRRRSALVAACAAVGILMAVLATSVSFMEDQGGRIGPLSPNVYYERVDPPPGRSWIRYRLDYVPFLSTIRSNGWTHAETLGLGPDFFPLHLLQARRQLPHGAAIPLALIWALPAGWLLLGAVAAAALMRANATAGESPRPFDTPPRLT